VEASAAVVVHLVAEERQEVGKRIAMARFKFTDKEKEDIKAAVAALEKESSGEIVPYIVERSDDYAEAPWLMAAITGVATLATEGVLAYTWSSSSMSDPVFIAIATISLMAIAFTVTTFIFPLRSLLVSAQKKDERVFRRAEAAFLEEEVFNTIDRTGILIFISHLEHEVIVIGDSGINAKVGPKDWENVVKLVLDGIKKGEITQGLVAAIGSCKELLLEHDFVARENNTNELSNDLRIGR